MNIINAAFKRMLPSSWIREAYTVDVKVRKELSSSDQNDSRSTH